MIPKAPKIRLTAKQKDILEKMAKATHGELHYKSRATIILKANEDTKNTAIAEQMNINRAVATKWRTRWAYASKHLEQVETETPHKLAEKIREVLSDEQRPGKPPVITPEQVARIIDLSLQKPESVGIPMTHWTIDALRDKVIELEIISSISSSQVARFLKRSRFKATPV